MSGCGVWWKGLLCGLRAPVTRVWRHEIRMENRIAPRFAGVLSQMTGPGILTRKR